MTDLGLDSELLHQVFRLTQNSELKTLRFWPKTQQASVYTQNPAHLQCSCVGPEEPPVA